MKGEEVVYRESQTFGRQSDAKSWGMQMVAMIERDGLPRQVQPTPTIRELISLYRTHPAISPTIGRTKAYCLDLVADCDIAKLNADELTIKYLVEHSKPEETRGRLQPSLLTTLATLVLFLRPPTPSSISRSTTSSSRKHARS